MDNTAKRAASAALPSLDSRYTAEEGTIFLSGVQALLRVTLEQARADRRAGLNTAGLICGYPGSPLGGVDLELIRNRQIFDADQVYHQLGLNEELAATALFGTQLLHEVPGARFDGVFGLWFGKSPGVDRAADAFHHANFQGITRNGGVLAVAGDDPHARSTILPSDSNTIFASLYMPILVPGNVQEVLDFGRHGFALSRAAGLWVGFKLVCDVADSTGTVEVGLNRISPVLPEVDFDGRRFEPAFEPNRAGPPMLEREREIFYARLEVARRYARSNRLNRIVIDGDNARRGVLASGKTYYDLREALHSLGLDEGALQAAGIRILKMGMVYPFDHHTALEFAEGLEEILVVEDKRPFLETALKEALYGRPNAPQIVGKNDARGSLLLTGCGELSANAIRSALVRWLDKEAAAPATPAGRLAPTQPLAEARTPYFCSGCPHNRSLKVPDGAVVGAGIGCHIMSLWMGQVLGGVTGYTQMGGEGAQWVGLHRFTSTRHFFQNLGDGTFAHSGSLAIRFAVAAQINITYKILYNSAVAMTGGQPVFGGRSVREIIQGLEAEGVGRIVVTTDEPARYRNARLGSNTAVRHRDDLLEVEKELAAIPGVTVLINDQQCAAEKRRLRKRGRLEKPSRRVLINERICEGCGDCGVKSNCLSVEPVETEFGRKTRINQSSCNQDYSCLLGDCPSFMTIESSAQPAAPKYVEPPAVLRDPVFHVPEGEFSVFMAGIGGTGVITINQILGMAAALAGRSVRAIDQLGSSQKAGPVVSHLRVFAQPRAGTTRIMSESADVLLAFDLLTASDPVNLGVLSSERTVLIANTDPVPTGGTVTDTTRAYPSLDVLRSRVAAVTRRGGIFIDALSLSRRLFGNEVAANMILVGAAYQAGALPLPRESIEAAIALNGVATETNLRAFRWGRYAAQEPAAAIAAATAPSRDPTALNANLSPRLETLVTDLRLSPVLAKRVRLRSSELCAYQNDAYAQQYLEFLTRIRSAELRSSRSGEAVTQAVALNLHKLMAYKDEYEVARLMVEGYARQLRTGEIERGQRIGWYVHPTFLRAVGVRRKVRLGSWFLPIAHTLAALRCLRGTWLDVLGRTQVRRLERSLIQLYRETVLDGMQYLDETNHALLVELAGLPDLIRGYEDVKLRNVEKFRERRTALLEKLHRKTPVAKSRPDGALA